MDRNILPITFIMIVSLVALTSCETTDDKIIRFEKGGDLDKLAEIHDLAAYKALDPLLYQMIQSRKVNKIAVGILTYRWIEDEQKHWVNTPQGIRSYTWGRWATPSFQDILDSASLDYNNHNLIAFLKEHNLWTGDANGIKLVINVQDHPAHKESVLSGEGYASEFDSPEASLPSYATGISTVFHERRLYATIKVDLDTKRYEFGASGHQLASALIRIAKEETKTKTTEIK